MGRFDGMLLVTDYDNTFHYTWGAQNAGEPFPPIPARNLEAVRYWMAEGGRFTVATGRALAAFLKYGGEVPVNAPWIVDNGASIYDPAAKEYVWKSVLPPESLEDMARTADAFQELSLELYHQGDQLQVLRPVPWNWQHCEMAGMTFAIIDRMDAETVSEPIAKALFNGRQEILEQARQFMLERGWGSRYEMIYSSDHLLEITAKGANKGETALRLKEMCGCSRMYCAGDQANDLPLLQAADRAFAPANAIEAVLTSGATVVGHCRDGAIADIVSILAGARGCKPPCK